MANFSYWPLFFHFYRTMGLKKKYKRRRVKNRSSPKKWQRNNFRYFGKRRSFNLSDPAAFGPGGHALGHPFVRFCDKNLDFIPESQRILASRSIIFHVRTTNLGNNFPLPVLFSLNFAARWLLSDSRYCEKIKVS